jgi:hypothetical protein
MYVFQLRLGSCLANLHCETGKALYAVSFALHSHAYVYSTYTLYVGLDIHVVGTTLATAAVSN